MSDGCKHDFVWLREETEKKAYDYYTVYDVFFCRHCLVYRCVASRDIIEGRTTYCIGRTLKKEET